MPRGAGGRPIVSRGVLKAQRTVAALVIASWKRELGETGGDLVMKHAKLRLHASSQLGALIANWRNTGDANGGAVDEVRRQSALAGGDVQGLITRPAVRRQAKGHAAALGQ